MICKHCEDGKKMPPDAIYSVEIYWCPQCTACIKSEVAEEAVRRALGEEAQKK